MGPVAQQQPSEARTPYAVAARELLRNTLLDAARDELAGRPWGDITMAEVARAAGVSRQTLYKEFGSREEFAQALVLREAETFLSAVDGILEGRHDDPRGALGEAFDFFLTAAAQNPLIRAALAGTAGDLLPLVTTQGAPLVRAATEHTAATIHRVWPEAAREDAELLAESLVRLAISHAILPAGPAPMTAQSVVGLLGPFIDRALGRG